MIGYILIGVIIGALLVAVLYYKKKSEDNSEHESKQVQMINAIMTPTSQADNSIAEKQKVEIAPKPIEFKSFRSLSIEEESRLVELKGIEVFDRIDSVIPSAMQVITSTSIYAGVNAGSIYQAILPAGAHLANSTGMEGAYRGFFHGAKGIAGHANFKAPSGLANLSAVNAIMSVASVVVGQYYMTKINNRLKEISEGIDAIADFLNYEYISKLRNIAYDVEKYSTYKTEIIDNESERERIISQLFSIEKTCGELLGQANSTINGYTDLKDLDYDDYEKSVFETQVWFTYQQILLELLNNICELTYVMKLGTVSREYSFRKLEQYFDESTVVYEKLNIWHGENIERLEIDISAGKRKRQGFEGFLMSGFGLFDDDLNYKEISQDTIEFIAEQHDSVYDITLPEKEPDLFNMDVQLIAKDGKMYYLPPMN